jgi:transposase-like protein
VSNEWQGSVGLLKCPRCGHDLLEMGGDLKWRGHWRCDNCLLAFEFVRERLVQGRSPREAYTRPSH